MATIRFVANQYDEYGMSHTMAWLTANISEDLAHQLAKELNAACPSPYHWRNGQGIYPELAIEDNAGNDLAGIRF